MSRSLLVITSSLVALVVLMGLLFVSLFASASPSVQAAAKDMPASAVGTPTDCDPRWELVYSPDPTSYDVLNSVGAAADNDVWAVGYSYDPHIDSLIEHWDGSTWSVVPSPALGALNDVTALSSSNAWAVGNRTDGASLVEHWNGSTWSVVPSPNVGTSDNTLNSIAAVSGNDIWAVGSYSSESANQPLIEHWDGNIWTVIASPDLGVGDQTLFGVAAVSSDDIWTVGSNNISNSRLMPIIEHWDGSEWTSVASRQSLDLRSIDAVSANDVWAVGNYVEQAGEQALAEHWDGSTWSIVRSPVIGDPDSFTSVEAVSTNDVWAVGVTYRGVYPENLVEHWDGTAWTVVNSYPGYGLNGITAVSSTDLWTVGVTFGNHGFQTLIERYDTYLCLNSPTPTITPAPRCPGERFTDVCPGDYFYQHVLGLNDLGVVSGYTSAPPCRGAAYIPCYKPESSTTRGQIAKIVSLAAGFNEELSGQTFSDVPPTQTFYEYIERMAARDIITGYPCGGAAEPCDTENRPYFRPGNSASRGQLSKMVVIAFGFAEAPGAQKFEDVLPGSTYYDYIWRLSDRSIINGYPCGGQGEPCGVGNLPYFRPANPVTRGQIAEIVNLTRLQPVPTPTPTIGPSSTPALTTTPNFTPITTSTATATATGTPTTDIIATPTSTATPTP